MTKDFEMERVSWLMQVGPYEREAVGSESVAGNVRMEARGWASIQECRHL